MSSQPIFTQEEIDGFQFDTTRYNLSLSQIQPVLLQHVAEKNDTFNIKSYNINNTVETIQGMLTTEGLFKYLQNKLNKYEAKINEYTNKSEIQEQV